MLKKVKKSPPHFPTWNKHKVDFCLWLVFCFILGFCWFLLTEFKNSYQAGIQNSRVLSPLFLPVCCRNYSIYCTLVYLRHTEKSSRLFCCFSVLFLMKSINAFCSETTLQPAGEEEALYWRPGVQDFRWGGWWCWCCWKRLSFKYFSVRATGQIWIDWKGGCNCSTQWSNMGPFSELYSYMVDTVCQKTFVFTFLKKYMNSWLCLQADDTQLERSGWVLWN